VDGRQSIALEEKEYSLYGPDWSITWPLIFSAEGSVVASRLSSTKTSRGCVGVDGRRGEEFDRVGPC